MKTIEWEMAEVPTITILDFLITRTFCHKKLYGSGTVFHDL